jgi:hypothetical protein
VDDDFEGKMIMVERFRMRRLPRASAIPGKTAAITASERITTNTASTADIAHIISNTIMTPALLSLHLGRLTFS